MKKISFQITMLETVDGFRVDCTDWMEANYLKLNPETRAEAFKIVKGFLREIEGLEVI